MPRQRSGRIAASPQATTRAAGIPACLLAGTGRSGNRAAVDSSHLRAMKSGSATGPSPVDRGKRGQPLRRPRRVYADRGYGHERYRDQVRRLEITPVIARPGTEHGSGLGVHRWVVEGAFALTGAATPGRCSPAGAVRTATILTGQIAVSATNLILHSDSSP
jgi:hypothetical protein